MPWVPGTTLKPSLNLTLDEYHGKLTQEKVILFINHCRPPPLCGAVPADNSYVAKPGDKVAARVKSSDGEENWILAEVVTFNTTINKYEVDDIDAEEGKELVFLIFCAPKIVFISLPII